MRAPPSSDVTGWLRAWADGDPQALERLVPAVYDRLRRLARNQLRHERPGHTLQSTDLVSEMYLRLVKQGKVTWENRVQFFAMCSRLARHILIDHARRRGRAKRGGETERSRIDAASLVAREQDADLIALDEALKNLQALDARKGRLVELRFFGGLTIAEAAAVLGCSHATVEREWRTARAWLQRAVRRGRLPRVEG